MVNQIVVAAAIIVASEAGPRLLIAQRRQPPELAGRWELPGGKVMTGETEPAALARELVEELGLPADTITVGQRLGDDVVLDSGATLRAYRVAVARAQPRPHDHEALRWVSARELADVEWVPADRAWLGALHAALQ